MSALTENQEALVKSSWEELKQNIPQLDSGDSTSSKGYVLISEGLHEIPQNNPKLKEHAVKIFKMTCEAATQLREKGQVVVVDPMLKHLGSVHVQKGVVDSQYEVVKEALLRTIKEAMGDKWNDAMRSAWATAYDEVAATIKKEKKQIASQS